MSQITRVDRRPAPDALSPADGPTFAELGVPADLVASLAHRGIDQPFPIQVATLPDALAGRDVCGRAPTGSGKTIAFGIPLVVRTPRSRPRRPRALVLVPTRELATQVCHELRALTGPKGPWVESFFGGTGFDRQIKALRRGVDIAVACPGRLADLINQGQVDLSEVEIVVLDEADRMADMGFLPEVKRLLDRCRSDRQTLLFSATLDGAVDVLVRRYQRDPARHEHAPDDEDVSLAEHHFWAVNRGDKVRTTSAIIERLGATVVFCRTKRGADRVARQLGTAGVPAAAFHGDRSQPQREAALRAFHEGRVTALVATDVAARGIHVEGVAGVVHFDPPADPKDYVHRSGRTARAGAAGVIVTLVPDDVAAPVRKLQRAVGQPVGLANADVELLGPRRARAVATPHRSTSEARDGGGAGDGRPSGKPARGSKRGVSTKPARAGKPGRRAAGKAKSGTWSSGSRAGGKPSTSSRRRGRPSRRAAGA